MQYDQEKVSDSINEYFISKWVSPFDASFCQRCDCIENAVIKLYSGLFSVFKVMQMKGNSVKP